MRKSRNIRDGFALVELLVVIAVIAILSALLVPSLKKAMEMGRRTVCKSDLRQIGHSIVMYVNDHHGRMPNAGLTPDGDSPTEQWGIFDGNPLQ